jgi:hypothetical protein
MRRIVVLVLVLILALPALAAARPAAELPPAPAGRLFLPHVAGGSGCGDFYDDFSANSGWFTGERDGLLAEVRDGEYRLLVTRPGFVWLVGAPGCTRIDNSAAVDARWAGRPGNFYGLLYAADGRLDRALLLAVNSDARVWLLFRVHAGGLETLSGPTPHDAIRPGNAVNRLALARSGGRVVLSVNGATVGEIADPLPGEAVAAGLVAASYTAHAPADARFDNISHIGRGYAGRPAGVPDPTGSERPDEGDEQER